MRGGYFSFVMSGAFDARYKESNSYYGGCNESRYLENTNKQDAFELDIQTNKISTTQEKLSRNYMPKTIHYIS